MSHRIASCISDSPDVRAPHCPGSRPSLTAKEVNSMLKYFTSRVTDLRTQEEGQTMAEYGVVLAVITAGMTRWFLELRWPSSCF